MTLRKTLVNRAYSSRKWNENYIAEFPQAIHESVVYRLGNYTLLEVDKNRDCETLPFEEKKKIYATSQYKLSRDIQSNTWSPNSIDIQQDRLANYASSIWRILSMIN